MIARTLLLLVHAISMFPFTAVSKNIQTADTEKRFSIFLQQHFKQNQDSDGTNQITNSFTLVQQQGITVFWGSQTKLVSFDQRTLLNAELGNQLDKDFRILQSTSCFKRNTSQFNISFSFSENTDSTPFLSKWVSCEYYITVEEYLKYKQTEQLTQFGLSTENNRDAWLAGNYSFEIWHGNICGTRDYSFQ